MAKRKRVKATATERKPPLSSAIRNALTALGLSASVEDVCSFVAENFGDYKIAGYDFSPVNRSTPDRIYSYRVEMLQTAIDLALQQLGDNADDEEILSWIKRKHPTYRPQSNFAFRIIKDYRSNLKGSKPMAKKKTAADKPSKSAAIREALGKLGIDASTADVSGWMEKTYGYTFKDATQASAYVSQQRVKVKKSGGTTPAKRGRKPATATAAKPGRKPGRKPATVTAAATPATSSALVTAADLIAQAGGVEAAQAALNDVVAIQQRLNGAPF